MNFFGRGRGMSRSPSNVSPDPDRHDTSSAPALPRPPSIGSNVAGFGSAQGRISGAFASSAAQLMSLSGVLNDPKAPKFAKLDLGGVHVPPVPLKKVRLSDFEGYIKAITGYHDRYQYHRMTGLANVVQGVPVLKAPSSTHLGAGSENLEAVESIESPGASLYNLLGIQRPSSREGLSLPSPAPKSASELEPLASIPQVFFEEGFTMENPRIFDLVTRGVDLDHTDEPQKLISHTLDVVESHLVREISQRASSFFTALSNLNTLHEETTQCVDQINKLHTHLQELSLVHSKKALETVYITQRKQNVSKLYDLIHMMHDIRQAQPMIQVMLQQGDFVGALSLISESNYALAGQGARDLKGVKTMSQFRSKMIELNKTVSAAMENEFCDVLLSHMRAPHLSSNEDTRLRLLPIVAGLSRIDGLSRALQSYQDKLLAEVKQQIKKHYPPELLTELEGPKEREPQASKVLKTFTLEKFLSLLDSVYKTCSNCLERTVVFHDAIAQCIKDAERQRLGGRAAQLPGGSQSSEGPENDGKTLPAVSGTSLDPMVNTSLQVTHAAADLCHVRCAKLLSLRSDQNAQLSLKDYQRLYSVTNQFLATTDKLIQGHTALGLKGALQGQSRAFITHFHMERMKQLAMLIENETWSQSDVLLDFQVIFDGIVDTPGSPTHDDRRRRTGMATTTSASCGSLDTASGPTKLLLVGDEKFPVASVVLMFGKMLAEYLNVLEAIPFIAMDGNQKLIDLAKLFNSRSCQMILGAGAVQSAGLKSITAKHLAVTSQSLGAVIALLPHIRRNLAQYMSEKQMVFLNEHDKVLRDFKEHQQEVYAKLVAIMEERAIFHCKAFATVDWESQPVPTDETTLPPPTPSMEALVKETTTLHKVLSKYLSFDTLRSVMQQVFKTYNTHLEREIESVNIFSVGAKNTLLIDIQYFIHKLNALEGVDGPGSALEVVVNNKKILDRSQVPPPLPPSDAGPGQSSRMSTSHSGSLSNPSGGQPSGTTGSAPGQGKDSGPAGAQKGFNLKNLMPAPRPGAAPAGSAPSPPTAAIPATSGQPQAQPQSGSPAPAQGAAPGGAHAASAAMTDAANKTKQLASDWMKKMNFMKE